jgi:hypothetical protein
MRTDDVLEAIKCLVRCTTLFGLIEQRSQGQSERPSKAELGRIVPARMRWVLNFRSCQSSPRCSLWQEYPFEGIL